MTRTRKRLLAGVCIGALLLVGRDASAIIPVTDVAALTQLVQQVEDDVQTYALQAKQWVTEQMQWATAVQQYATQIQQYTAEIEMVMNFIHAPALGTLMGLMQTAGLGNSLPASPYSAMGLVYGMENLSNGGGVGALQGLLNSLTQISNQAWNSGHVYTPTDASWSSAQTIQAANSNAGMSGAMSSAYGDFAAHSGVLQPIRTDMLAADDTKSILDATGQATLETAWNVNQMGKVNSMTGQYLVYQEVRRQRDDECLTMDMDAFLAASPVTIGAKPADPGACPKNPPVPAGAVGFGGAAGGGPGQTALGPDLGDPNVGLPTPPPPPPAPVVVEQAPPLVQGQGQQPPPAQP